MKSKFLCLVLAASASFSISQAADPVTATTSDTLNATYVEGVRLISDANAAIERGNRVLSIVEQGADGQVGRIAEMEARLQNVKWSANQLETNALRRVEEGMRLSAEKIRIEARFRVLATALQDDRLLLTGATKTVERLLDVADKSGKLAERRLADQIASELKVGAAQVRLASDRLEQMKLRVTLESTLLQGLQARAGSEASDIKALKAELTKLENEVAVQRSGASKLTVLLTEDRTRLAQRQNSLGQMIETFRVVQVSVLRHWLIDGPPAGDLPSLTIDDVMDPAIEQRKMRRPDPSTTILGSGAGSMSPADASSGLSAFNVSSEEEADSTQASSEVMQLHKKARWYLAMLSRLTTFTAQSLNEANVWVDDAEVWRDGLSNSGRTLADQRGALTSLAMEQGIVATTVELMTKQAATAREQVSAVVVQVEKQTQRLAEISAELKKQAEKL